MTEAGPTSGHVSPVVGRAAELARIDAFVADVAFAPRALLVRGDPGIGKTILWAEAVARCRAGGYRVLVTRPAEEEMPLALVGLFDLFEPADLGAPTAPGAPGAPDTPLDPAADDPGARGRAVLAALRRLAADGPAVLAIDDLQWLDSASAAVLRYALRRLETEPVGVLATVRTVAGGDVLALDRGLPPGRAEVLEVGPLGLDDLRQVLGQSMSAISRPLLRRIHEVSGGNPLYAIELARGVAAAGGGRSPDALPLPDSLQAAIDQRLASAPPGLAPLLQTLSALGPTTVPALREALPDLDVDRLVSEAQADGILAVEQDLQVRFAHPLLGSAVYTRMGPVERASLHAWLAERALDDDVRARHLAISGAQPSEDAAAALDAAADRAAARGAADLAAEFARHSLRLTPADEPDHIHRRALAEVGHLAAAGEVGRAVTLADALAAELPPGTDRAALAIQQFYLMGHDLDATETLLERAIEDAGEDLPLRAEALDLLAWLLGVFRGDLAAGLARSAEAVDAAERSGDPRMRMYTSSHLAVMSNLAGKPRPDLVERAMAQAESLGGPRLSGGPRVWAAKQRLWSGDIDGARPIFEEARDDFFRAGTELQRPYRLFDLALVECAAGNLAAAEDLAREGIEAAHDARNPHAELRLLHPYSLVRCWRGAAKEARETSERLMAWEGSRGERPGVVRGQWVLGLLALSEGDTAAAAEQLTAAAALLQQLGYRHPGAFPVLPDAVEALSGAGDLEAAERLLARLEDEAPPVGPWPVAAASRARGIVRAARGEAGAAAEAFAEATAGFERTGHRPDVARCALARGRALVRAGRRTQAADALADARRRFAEMGAALWEARAAEELDRVAPGRSSGELTPTERRVAALVARGMRNRQIAGTLFMSEATVEAHLTRMYRKLDIASRSELTRLVTEGSIQVTADS